MSEHVFGGLFPISEWLEIIMPEIKEYIRYKEYHILNRIRLGDRIVNIHVIPVREGTLLALEDITDISKMEEQMRQKERLAALGTLSAGIAHEVRNPLTAIKGFAQMIAKRPTSEKNAKYIKFIIDEVSKLENLVREILDFAKEKKPSKSYIKLDNILQSVRAIVSDIDIQLENDIEICADENLMSSVFLNIIKNAKDAGATEVVIKADKKEGETEIKIINNGPPIPEDILPHIFEPFSTRKSKGTGLGLAIVHNIITSHGGNIKAYNDINGVVFSITLPDDCQGDEA
jgi:two-component system sensor histidine kinase AtoS